MLLGADRVGFATMAMAAIGCYEAARSKHRHMPRRITSQLKIGGALAAGQKHFKPREYDSATEHLVRFLSGRGEEDQARDGAARTQSTGIWSVRWTARTGSGV